MPDETSSDDETFSDDKTSSAPKPRTGKPSRRTSRVYDEPTTIDLKATAAPDSATAPGSPASGASGQPEAEPSLASGPSADLPGSRDTATSDPVEARSAIPPSPARSPAGTPSSGRFDSYALAGFVGGLIGAALMIFANTWFQSPSSTLDARVAELDRRLTGLAPQAALQALDRRVAAAETEARGLGERVRAAEALAQRGAATAGASPQPNPPAQAAEPSAAPAVAELQQRLAALEAQIAARPQPAEPAPAAAPPQAQPPQRSAEELQALAQRLTGEAGEARAREIAEAERRLGERLRSEIAPLQAGLSEAQQASRGTATEVQGVRQTLTEQEARQAALAARVESFATAEEARRAGLRVIVTDAVAEALRDGTPYAPALTALGRIGGEPARLAALQPYAGGGAPSASALAREFRPIAERLRRESRPADAPVTDRLQRMLESVVSVRAVGEPQGDDLDGRLGRVEAALERGALADAAAAFAALPEPARQAAKAFGDKLQARAAAEDAARALQAQAIAALEGAAR